MIKRLKPQQVRLSFDHISNAIQSLNSEQSINDYIKTLCFLKRHREAIEAFNHVTKSTSFRIRQTTYGRLICSCSSLRSLSDGKRIHNHIVASNSQLGIVIYNHILNMYGKCGSLKEALDVFDEMPERNLVSWTSLISGFSQNGYENEAVEFYFEMRGSGFMPDEFAFGSVIKACSGLGVTWLGRQVHAHVVQSDCGDGLIAQNALIAMYTRFGQISDAYNVFSGIRTRDLVSWGSMIAGFAQLGYEIKALSLFKEMLSQTVFRPNEFIFGSTFSACSNLVDSELGKQIHGMCLKSGLGDNIFAGCSLCDMYVKSGQVESARSVFWTIVEPDLVSWNAIISGLADSGNGNEALSFFSRMRHKGIKPNDVTLLSLLSASVTACRGRQVHSYLVKIGFYSNITVCNALLTMYASCSVLPDAFRVFECIRNSANSVSWNAILTACVCHNMAEEVFRLFREMLLSPVRPDHVAMSNAISACSSIASLEIGEQVHSFSTKTGLVVNISVANGLIDMYTKCGSLGTARKLFDLMECCDVVSYTSLIVGYAQFGDGREALELFETMKDFGVKPNEVTLVGVLTACSHVGLVEEGWKIYQSMETEHGILPTREHCSCMVDLLARLGQIKEAEDFIEQMGFEPDIVVWKTLLAACRMLKNVEAGKRAAEKIVELDPTNSAAHVLLSGLHASSGNWENVARLRKLMRERGVRKVPGQSWIEIRGQTHAFLAEDTSHPERESVYEMLDELGQQMLEEDHELVDIDVVSSVL